MRGTADQNSDVVTLAWAHFNSTLTATPVPVSAERYMEMLEVLPPARWAHDGLESARAALALTIEAAAWGSHDNGRVFVTRRSGWPQDHSGVTRVYVDRVEVCSLEQRNWHCWVPVVADPEAALAVRAAERAYNQAHARWYAGALEEAAGLLRHADPEILTWQTDDGQRGGRVHTGTGWLSLPGVMRCAGLEATVVEQAERPRLATRDRSMPACDRRRALATEVSL